MMRRLKALVPLRVKQAVGRWRERRRQRSRFDARWQFASRYLVGDGIEIGALHLPLRAPKTARVRYVDRFPLEQLREHYPELASYTLVTPSILDDGETLLTVPDGSLDFVIVNHVIEHCQDPIGSLGHWMRVLKPGGILYLTVPDKRYTFDRDRPLTSWEHLHRDHVEGAIVSRREHFEAWARELNGAQGEEVAQQADHMMSIDYSIHFHVWDSFTFLEFMVRCRPFLPPFEIETTEKIDIELILILRKVAA